MTNTKKFSEFFNAGVQVEGQTTVGLDGGANARFTTAPQFLPAGSTGTRPDPAVAGMIRYNTSLNLYEFYNGSIWSQFEDSADIALLIARLAAHTPGDGASMIGLEDQGAVVGQTVQDMAEADFIVKSVKTALANAIALSDLSTGILVNETGTGNLVARSVAGTTSQITVTNGDGLAGNPTFEIADNPTLPGSSHVQIPFGGTAARPAMPTNGYFRYNTDLDELEYWNNNAMAWEQIENTGALLSVVGTANEIDVDNTDPVNPVLSLSSTLVAPGTIQVGNLFFDTNTISSLDTNGNIIFEADGVGSYLFGTNTAPTNSRANFTIGGNFLTLTNVDTDATTKIARFGCNHLDNSEEPLVIIHATVDATSRNQVNIGGGSALGNAATEVKIFGAANQTTLNGTEIARFTPNGLSFDGGTNFLDTYIVGSWTPILVGSITPGTPTYTVQTGTTWHTGDRVILHARIDWTDLGGLVGNVTIANLPITSINDVNKRGMVFGHFYTSISLTVGGLYGYVNSNATTALLVQNTTTASANVTDVSLTATGTIYLTFIYEPA